VWLVVMIWHHSNMPKVEEAFQVCEFFSGDAKVSQSCHHAFISTASLDIKLGGKVPNHRRNPFDLTLPSGFAILGVLIIDWKLLTFLVFLIID